MKALFPVTALLSLAACDKPAAPTSVQPTPVATAPLAPPAPVAAPVTAPVIMAHYLCAGGKTIDAGYPSPTTLLLIWQSNAYTLTRSTSGSDARYAGFGLQWWSKGLTDATLSTLKAGETVASDPGMVCKAQIGALTLPAPGTPMGLAADGASIVAAAGPASAQGAANVVQTYYALLEKRSSVSAAANRVDGVPENLSKYSTLHAQVGAPGAIVVTGSTLTVEVPFVLSGRLADGAGFTKSGKAALKRSNDATSPWLIERINLK